MSLADVARALIGGATPVSGRVLMVRIDGTFPPLAITAVQPLGVTNRAFVNRSNIDQMVMAANPARNALIFDNNTGAEVFISFGAGAATTAAGGYNFRVGANSTFMSPAGARITDEIHAIWAAGGANALTVTEL